VAQTSSNSTDKSSSNDEDKKIIDEAHARFALIEDAESENRNLAIEDLEFASGKQWHDADISSRKADGRPCLTINKIPQVINQITNDQRQNRPAIKVHPVDDEGDVETAKVIQGLIRHIEYNSNAEVAYDNGFEFATKIGWGYWRVITDYVNPESFEQEILIKRIANPFSVFFDPNANEPDGSDANYAFVTEDLSAEEYKARYPKSKLAGVGEWESIGNQVPSWMPSGSARVAEYFYKENKEETIALLNTGETVIKSKLPEILPEGLEIVKERTTSIPKICWVKMNACEVLEKTEWLGKYIPIVPVYGSDTNINGKRTLKGIVRDAKDPARMYNYFASAESEAIALAPKAPFIADPKQIEGYEGIWETANRKNHSYLPYNMVVNGQVLPPPQRASSDISTQAITQARMLASDDIKATTGIYDASLGNKSNETSGVAIQRRNVQAQTSNFHFMDNLTRSLRHTGRILIDLIPKVYDTARSARIVAEDGEERVVKVNDPTFEENGKPTLYALDAGKYDVTVDVGPSFQSKRQEAAQNMIELSKSIPSLGQAAPDLIVKTMDFNGSQELADRLKKTLPPGLADDKDQSKDIPPQVQAQMQQMNQMVEQLTGKLNELQTEKDQKLVELESRERIEFKKLEVQLEIERAKLDAKDALSLLNAEIDQINQRMSLLHMQEPIQYSDSPQNLAPQPQVDSSGGYPADLESGANEPTGGFSPGTPMEGQEP
jgi:hypothetical protein